MNDPTYGAVITRAREWTQHKKPLDWLEIERERKRAEAISDLNTLRVIAEKIAHEPAWRAA